MNAFKEEALNAGWTLFCEDVPVETQEVIDFWQEIKRKMPELMVVCGTWRSMKTAPNLKPIATFAGLDVAHIKNPTEVIGAVGYHRYEEKFVVESRLIANAKYAYWNSDHRTQKSKHMSKLFKTAKNVLVPKQIHEVYKDNKDGFLQNIASIRNNAIDGLRDYVNRINMYDWRQELLNMERVGYVPQMPAIKKALDYVVTTKEEFEHNSTYSPPTGFVWIKPDGVVYQKFLDSHAKQDGEPVEVSSTDELPESIRQKMFVLMIGEENRFIEEVGMKVNDSKFWVIL